MNRFQTYYNNHCVEKIRQKITDKNPSYFPYLIYRGDEHK